MLKKTVGAYWRICWGLFTPVVLIIVFFYFVATLERIEYEGKPYPNIVLGTLFLTMWFLSTTLLFRDWMGYFRLWHNSTDSMVVTFYV